MAMSEDAGTEPPSWFEASHRVLDPLLNARSVVALLQAAEAVGLLATLRSVTTPAEAALASGLSESRVRGVCDALVANEVVERVGPGLRLTPAWGVLTGPTAFSALGPGLRAAEAGAAALRDLATAAGFAGLTSPERLAYATAVSPDPFSPGVVAAIRQSILSSRVADRLREDDRHLELGCGVAGRVLCVLQAFPRATAVGVEVAPDLAAEAWRRAEALGVADRFTVIVGNASSVRLDGLFDVAFWSQFFFPEATRAGTLATAYAALRPGGLVLAPLLGDAEAAAADPHGTAARSLAPGPGRARPVGRPGPVGRRAGRRGAGGGLRRRDPRCGRGSRRARGGGDPPLTHCAIPPPHQVGGWDARHWGRARNPRCDTATKAGRSPAEIHATTARDRNRAVARSRMARGVRTPRPPAPARPLVQEDTMLTSGSVTANIPAADLDRARAFYA
ncbi:MAG: class I SAM-dependent methyltransferase, partial [Lapillicoccus sp.]